jgi:ribonucleotide monophosphatase NagD (HAD superfamily)
VAQGAFLAALQGVWAEATKGLAKLEYSIVGKPTEMTYEYAERALLKYHEQVVGSSAAIETVYMIGDNPASDIAGANSFRSLHGLH